MWKDNDISFFSGESEDPSGSSSYEKPAVAFSVIYSKQRMLLYSQLSFNQPPILRNRLEIPSIEEILFLAATNWPFEGL